MLKAPSTTPTPTIYFNVNKSGGGVMYTVPSGKSLVAKYYGQTSSSFSFSFTDSAGVLQTTSLANSSSAPIEFIFPGGAVLYHNSNYGGILAGYLV